MKRICMVIDRFPPLVGGVEAQAKQLSTHLTRRGVPVIILTRRSNVNQADRSIIDDFTVYRVRPMGNKRGYLIALLEVPFFMWGLFKRRREYDIIHVHDISTLPFCALIVGLFLQKPVIIKIPAEGAITRFVKPANLPNLFSFLLHYILLPPRIARYLLKRASAYIAISSNINSELTHFGVREKIHAIPNGVDHQRFHPSTPLEKQSLRRKLGLPPHAQILISHGNIVEGKRLDVLIQAVALVSNRYADIYVLIVGSSLDEHATMLASLKADVAKYELQETVHFVGMTARPEDYLRASDIFVLSSQQEGLPNALIEAMACGLACIGSRIGGVEDLIDEGVNGYLFPVGDAQNLAKILANYLSTPENMTKHGVEAFQYTVEKYAWNKIIPQYINLYENLSSKK